MTPVRYNLWISKMLPRDLKPEKIDGLFLYRAALSVISVIFCVGLLVTTAYNLDEVRQLRSELDDLKLKLEVLGLFDEIGYEDIADAYTQYGDTIKFGPDAILKNSIEDDYMPADEVTGSGSKKPAGPLTKDLYRHKRSIVAQTADGVQINSDSYAHAKKHNKSGKFERQSDDDYYVPPEFRSYPWMSPEHEAQLKYYGEIVRTSTTTAPPKPIISRKSRVMNDRRRGAKHTSTRRPVLKSLDTAEQMETEEVTTRTSVGRSHKPRHRKNKQRLETMDESVFSVITPSRKPAVAAHFNGNTSEYILGQHTNFNGNGHLKHPSTTYIDFVASDWVEKFNLDAYFHYNQGVLTVKEAGLYLIYAQIYYLDMHDTNGFRVFKNEHPFIQCTVMSHSGSNNFKGNTCYTSRVEYIEAFDRLKVVDISQGRYSIFEEGKSFFGIVKLADTRGYK